MDFKELIRSDREKHNLKKFQGNFLDYLEIVKDNPNIAKLSHKRIYDLVMEKGLEVLRL